MTDIAELVWKLRGRAEDITSMAVRQPVAARGRFPEPTPSDTLEGKVADALESLEAENKRLRARAERAEADIEKDVHSRVEHWRSSVERLQEQRDVAINALKAAHSLLADFGQYDSRDWPVFQQICAALAKAEGRP